MIKIKKVEVTPIDRNIGKIVDSTATQDNKTKNTYSMRVIDEKTSDIKTQTIQVKVRGRLSTGGVDYNSSKNGIILFEKRGGMVIARFFIPPVQTYGQLLLFNQDDTDFSIPNVYKTLIGVYPVTHSNYNMSDTSKLIEGNVATGEIALNDEVIFSGTYVSFDDYTGIIVNGELLYNGHIYYMAKEV